MYSNLKRPDCAINTSKYSKNINSTDITIKFAHDLKLKFQIRTEIVSSTFVVSYFIYLIYILHVKQ